MPQKNRTRPGKGRVGGQLAGVSPASHTAEPPAPQPGLALVPDCGRDRFRKLQPTPWKAGLQRDGALPSRADLIRERHFRRDFGPVPEGGAEIFPFASLAGNISGGSPR